MLYVNYNSVKNKLKKKAKRREFPGGPVVRTPHFHCRGPGLNPLVGEPRSCSQKQKKKKKKRQNGRAQEYKNVDNC